MMLGCYDLWPDELVTHPPKHNYAARRPPVRRITVSDLVFKFQSV
jgi:hypothetical protein